MFEEQQEDGFKSQDDLQNLRKRKFLQYAKESFSDASKLLRRKIPCTGHFMTPRRLWIQTVPTLECDVIVMFPNGAQDNNLMWLLERLRSGTPGLTVHVRHHASSDSYGFYLTAPFSVLLKAAEEVHLPKALKSEHGGGLKECVQTDALYFKGIESEELFFTSQERQFLVLHLLQTLRAATTDNLPGLKLIDGQTIIPKCESAGLISQVFPLHDLEALQQLQNEWVCSFFKMQPLDKISNYFGVKIAMYFAWLGHYTTALIVPAVIGLAFSIGFGRGDQATEDVGFVLFSFFNVLWFSIYLEAWKRYCAELAYKWGTLDQRDELLVEPRPLFSGPLQVSPVTGRLEPNYPAWKRYVFRYFITVPVIAFCLAIVFIIMMLNLKLQDWWDKEIEKRGYAFCLSYLPKIMLAIGITLLDEAYYKVACWLNDRVIIADVEDIQEPSNLEQVDPDTSIPGRRHMEPPIVWLDEHRLQPDITFTGEPSLLVENPVPEPIKYFSLFQFVNSFLSLFYIAFYLQDQEKLKEQLAALLIARQVIGNLKESALPYFMEQIRLAKMSFEMFGALSPSDVHGPKDEPSSLGNRHISQAELESSLFKYDGTFADHLEMFIQLGYVVLFSSAFPLAALCALINNLVEMRSDAFKLCYIFQRPFGQRVPNIGTWQNAMEVMGLIAVLVNCALIGLSGHVHRMFPEMSTTQTILLIIALEHGMLLLRLIVKVAIPDIPEWVATEMAKVEFARREAMRKFSSTGTPPLGNEISLDQTTTKAIGRFVVTPSPNQKEEGVESAVDESDKEIPTEIEEREETDQECPTPPHISKPKVLPNTWREPLSHHMTIGPHASIDWVRKLNLESVRKTSEPDMGGSSLIHRSIDCLAMQKEASSDSDLLRSAPHWPRQRFQISPTSSSLTKPAEVPKDEELAAKKLKVKQSLMKRARSVAIFSLKLKEKRAAAEAKAREKPSVKQQVQSQANQQQLEQPSGELSCVPIEKLISVDDVSTARRRKAPSSPSNS